MTLFSSYRRYLPELAAQGVQYHPIIWSSWGRPHADASAALKAMAARAARRRGFTSGRALYRHVRAAIGLQLQRRAAKMAIACQRLHADGDESDHG